MAAGLVVKPSWACIVIIVLIVTLSSGAASGEARRLLMAEKHAAEGACAGGCSPPVQGLTATTTSKMATTDGRPTAPGHSPGIGNKIAGNTR
ncbi:hypothetical protein Zm00014a_034520 [Zea mays]|jgi:hypothetical protein|uniref:Uncharacterized protein n=2 Tax=Zea mays TaxID=4577 RepID=A0A8J8XRH0_MAIZE|nr:hypothetical protein ZEAMMB73_Zm00001d020746 [Zea mays]PWZ14010.1 hypothetical protein Zm00014a_034520 [Zea mays]